MLFGLGISDRMSSVSPGAAVCYHSSPEPERATSPVSVAGTAQLCGKNHVFISGLLVDTCSRQCKLPEMILALLKLMLSALLW